MDDEIRRQDMEEELRNDYRFNFPRFIIVILVDIFVCDHRIFIDNLIDRFVFLQKSMDIQISS